MSSSAHFSPCRAYRYSLWRDWSDNPSYASTPYVMFVGLNPSTADETKDDPTIRRCMGFAKAWGYSAIFMLNLFAFRATDPRVMKRATHPVGPSNDTILKSAAEDAGIVIAAWGAHGAYMNRGPRVREMLPNLHALKLTKDGHPSHPLYLPASLTPIPWSTQ